MQNCDAVKFYADMIVEFRNSYGLTTNDFDIDHFELTADQFFDYLDNEQLEWWMVIQFTIGMV